MKLPSMRYAALAAMLSAAGCGSGSSGDLGGSDQGGGSTTTEETPASAVVCKVNYATSMRSAAMALTGTPPAWTDLKDMLDAEKGGADAQKAVYEKYVDKAIASKEFAIEQVRFFRNVFATANYANMRRQNNNNMPMYMADMNCAANYAASLVVNEQPYTSLFSATSGTCPTFDDTTGAFTPGDVIDDKGTPLAMNGILNDPGLMTNYGSNMAMRRVRFVQETFACSKFPTETGGTPTPMGSALYTSPWEFASITGGEKAKINFQDTSAVICANCHTTINHVAPLFANFSLQNGLLQGNIQVRVPVQGTPPAALTDWLPANEPTAWRLGKPAKDLKELGDQLAADPDIAACAVNRVWNYAFARGDIVRDLATIPADVTAAQVKSFVDNQYNVKKLIRAVVTSTEYVSR